METQLVNRVANSGIVTLNLEDFFPKLDFYVFDISEYLFHGLILKEKEFRIALQELEWSPYKDKVVLIQCSSDAIIPLWAYMLITKYLTDTARDVFVGTKEEYIKSYMMVALNQVEWEKYADQRIVIKGCGDHPVPAEAYARITFKLQPFAKSIMFGEPCSTVPVYKKP